MIEIVYDSGECGWALCKVGPIFRKYALKKNPVHVLTLKDRVSLYSDYAESILYLPEWVNNFSPNCFHRDGFKEKHLERLRNFCYERLGTKDIVFHVPYKKFGLCQKNIPKSDMKFIKYKGNKKYRKMLNPILGDRKNIVIWPRRRMGGKTLSGRNWMEENWMSFIKLLVSDSRIKDYNIVTLGIKSMSALSGFKNFENFYNLISFCEEDYIGLCITVLENSIVAVGSQSAGPILSLHTGIPTVMFGHEQKRHQEVENPHNIKCDFLLCNLGNYNQITPKKLYKRTLRIIGG